MPDPAGLDKSGPYWPINRPLRSGHGILSMGIIGSAQSGHRFACLHGAFANGISKEMICVYSH